jgi:hypothetical protein
MVDIVNAKKELYSQLKDCEGVIGAGIKGNSNAEYIVIFVKDLSSQLKNLIPNSFKGIKVKTELQKLPRSM